jgi:hypothetical protein
MVWQRSLTRVVPGNPLLSRLLLDQFNDAPITVPAIQRLVAYNKALPEFGDRGWRERRAGILGDDLAAFHSTLVEISFHEALSTIPGLIVRFIDPKPGGRTRVDYKLRFGDAVLEAELKSILSEHVRLAEGTRFDGIHTDPVTARAIWRKFTQPIREGQLDPTRPGAIFLDVSMCDEIYMFLPLPPAIRSSELHDHAQGLLDQLAATRRAVVPGTLLFMLCGFEPSTYRVLFLTPVSPGESGS